MSDACPYCREPYSAENPATDDHIFVESLGGHATVIACRRCNNKTFGSLVEGKLQRPNELLAFKRHLEGDATKPLRGTSTSHPEAGDLEVDLVNQTYRVRQPVAKDGGTYTFQGPPEQVRREMQRAASKLGLTKERVNELVDAAPVQDIGVEPIEATLSLDLTAAVKLAAKIGLGAGAISFGEAFVDDELAESLREIAFSTEPLGAIVPIDPAALGIMSEASGVLEQSRNSDDSYVLFFNAGDGQTMLFVAIQGELLPPFGVLLDGTPPYADLMGTLVVDRPGGLVRTDLANAMAADIEALEQDEHLGRRQS